MKTNKDPNNYVINLTKKTFDKDTFRLLNKNMNFIPNPGKYNKKDFNNDIDSYFRRIMLKAHFKNENMNKLVA